MNAQLLFVKSPNACSQFKCKAFFFFFPLYRKHFDQASLGLVGWPAVLVGINTSIMTQQKEMGLLHEWCLFFTMYNSWVFYSFYWMCFRKWSICLFAFQELSDNMAFLMPCSIFLYFFSFLHFILKFCQQKNGEVTAICKMFYGMSYS